MSVLQKIFQNQAHRPSDLKSVCPNITLTEAGYELLYVYFVIH